MRLVAMTQEQYEDIEKYVEWLMRNQQESRASRMMMLAISYKFGRDEAEEEEPKNVIPLHAYLSRVSADTPAVNRKTSA